MAELARASMSLALAALMFVIVATHDPSNWEAVVALAAILTVATVDWVGCAIRAIR